MEKHNGNDIVNIGSGKEITIRELAMNVKQAVGFEGAIDFDVTKPNGYAQEIAGLLKIACNGMAAYH